MSWKCSVLSRNLGSKERYFPVCAIRWITHTRIPVFVTYSGFSGSMSTAWISCSLAELQILSSFLWTWELSRMAPSLEHMLIYLGRWKALQVWLHHHALFCDWLFTAHVSSSATWQSPSLVIARPHSYPLIPSSWVLRAALHFQGLYGFFCFCIPVPALHFPWNTMLPVNLFYF